MKNVNSLADLLLYNLGELYDAEIQQQKSISKLAEGIGTTDLESIFINQQSEANRRIERLENAFELLDEKAKARECDVMDELLDRVKEIADKVKPEEVRNAGIILGLQCINHYKIAAYGTTAAFAKTLKQDTIAELLHKTVEDEKSLDRQLTNLAEQKINVKALGKIPFVA